MPYIQLNISKKIDEAQREAVKASLGKHVSIIPGKSEEVLMIRIEDDAQMYMGGKVIDCVYMDVKLYMTAPQGLKGDYARAVIKDLEEIIGADKNSIYITFSEYGNWVSKGDIK